MRATLRLLTGALLVASVSACEDDPFVGPQEALDGFSSDFLLDLSASGGFPGGESRVTAFSLVADTAGVSDVFERAGADGYYQGFRYIFDRGVRIAGEDPRLPALAPVHDPDAFATSFARLQGPEWFGPPYIWDFWMRWLGLEPGATYTYALERLGTRVNGSLDQLELVLEGEVTDPDELIPLNPSPGGYPANDYSWTSQAGCAAEPIPATPPNPWYLGPFTANGDGRGTPDMCMGSPWPWYTNTLQNQPDSSIIMPNVLQRGVVPQYNYIVVYRGTPPNLGPPVIRIQTGVDLDLTGQPLANGFAPFPLESERAGFLELGHVRGAASRAEVVFDSLPALTGEEYHIWLFDPATGNVQAAQAEHVRLTPVVVGEDEGGRPIVEFEPGDTALTTSFASGGVGERHLLRFSPATLGAGMRLGDFAIVAVTLGGGVPAEAPLWARYLDDAGTPDPFDDQILDEAAVTFGRLELTAGGAAVPFRATGGADGSVWEDRLGIRVRNLRRPPPGFYYEGWLVAEDGSATSVGPLLSPPPELSSLRDADISTSSPVVTGGEILQGAFFVPRSELSAGFGEFLGFRVTLEPKAGGPEMSTAIVVSGELPERTRQ